MKIRYFSVLLLLLALFSANYVLAQKVKRADKDFDRYKFIDAREVYLKVVEDGYASAQIYENLGDTYYWNSDYDNAAKWYGKLINEFSEETGNIYYYRAAQASKSINNTADSDKFMKLYLEKGGDPGILSASDTEFLDYEVRLEKVSANSSYSDFGPSYYKDKVVFSSSVPGSEGESIHKWNDQPFTDLYMADVDSEGDISNPRRLNGEVNTRYHETSPTFTKDGKTMYFTRNNFIDGKKGKDEDKTIRLKIYKATNYGDDKWTSVIELPFNNEEYSTAHPALSPDEKRLYFVSERPGGLGLSDLWYVDILGEDSYSEPKNLGQKINTEARESFPFISENNNLYFSSGNAPQLSLLPSPICL
jgi:Tol biopolymer transport system component